MFKVKNIDSGVSIVWTHCSDVRIFGFEQVHTGWAKPCFITSQFPSHDEAYKKAYAG